VSEIRRLRVFHPTVVVVLLALAGCGGATSAPGVIQPPASVQAKPAASGGSTPASASAASVSAGLNQIIDGARKEGSLTLVWSENSLGGAAGARRVQDLINKKYGLNLTVNFTPGPAGPATVAKVVQEVNAGQPSHTDIYLFLDALSAKAAQPVEWRQLVPELPESAILYDQRSVELLTQLPGIAYNSNLVPGNKVPKSLEDLLDPFWKGKIAAPPYAYTIQFQALPEFMGHDKAISFVQKFSGQLGGLIRCGEDDRLASGEFLAFALDCGEYQTRKSQRRGLPLKEVIPLEGGALKYYTASIPLTAPHPNAAKLFLANLLSKDGQDFIWDVEASDLHKVKGSHMAEVVGQYAQQGVKFLDSFDLEQKHPEVLDYEKEIVSILQTGQTKKS